MPVDNVLDLSALRRIHILGIGGAGMSGLAQVLHTMGHRVSGSDLVESSVTERLRGLGMSVSIGHHASNLGDVDLVTASPAVSADNAELLAARSAAIPLAHRSDLLGALSKLRPTIAVAGTHGKTTTSSMLASVLISAGLDPSYLLGADLVGQGGNAHWGADDVLILEADESYGSFASLSPVNTGITNIEADHLDYYGTIDVLEEAFMDLLRRTEGTSAVMAWDEGADRIGRELQALRIGSEELPIVDVVLTRSGSSFTIGLPDGPLVVRLQAPGRHNVANASVAATLAHLVGVSGVDIARGLETFTGVPRRFEFLGQCEGVSFVDDYAHLPSEVAATVEAARAGDYQRIVAVFQPHRFTRTQAVGAEFGDRFHGADVVVVTDIYSAGEAPIPGVTGRVVFEAVQASSTADVYYVESVEEAASLVSGMVVPGDLCLSLGAGDITRLAGLVMGRL